MPRSADELLPSDPEALYDAAICLRCSLQRTNMEYMQAPASIEVSGDIGCLSLSLFVCYLRLYAL